MDIKESGMDCDNSFRKVTARMSWTLWKTFKAAEEPCAHREQRERGPAAWDRRLCAAKGEKTQRRVLTKSEYEQQFSDSLAVILN